ncbi:MAG TPA: thioredoxin family protein [Candidatus Limnocylindrales bacterium]|jgi:peroxiredoxin|nr:thioredoxin family protein [Candidatus Limnocylindrales bacterium]
MMSVEIVGASPDRATLPVGVPGRAFEGLLGTDGQRHGLSTLSDREAIVLIFSSNRCPTAKAYGERMNALQRQFGPRGVQVVAINSNDPHLYPDESYARMVDRATEHAYAFPYLVDEGQHVAKAYGATCTFHVFVLDQMRRIRYEGRFDDSRLEERVTSHDLANALDDVLAGRDVRVATTRPFGCSLDFV